MNKLFASLGEDELAALVYHDIFDYPLTLAEILRWRVGRRLRAKIDFSRHEATFKDGFYFFKGRDGVIFKRLVRSRSDKLKMKIAHRAAKILGLIPAVLVVGVTGALAMENAPEESDIDLLVITKRGLLWTSRLWANFLLRLFGIRVRRFGDRNEKDKICLNMWLTEVALVWPKKDRNAYTAHEICQIIPLVNKNLTFEKFLGKNQWVKGFWPNAIGKKYTGNRILYIGKTKTRYSIFNILISAVEPLARSLQFRYMKGKITREKVGKNRALFHPNDWGEVVLARLGLASRS